MVTNSRYVQGSPEPCTPSRMRDGMIVRAARSRVFATPKASGGRTEQGGIPVAKSSQ